MRSHLSYVGTTSKKRKEERKKTVRRSRRLALKRRRERRISAGDAMGVSPVRETGADLREAAAVQYALAAAVNDARLSGKKKEKGGNYAGMRRSRQTTSGTSSTLPRTARTPKTAAAAWKRPTPKTDSS